MSDMTGVGNGWDTIIKVGGFIIGVIVFISSVCVPLFLRLRKKLEFVDCSLKTDEGKITAITFKI